MNKRRTCPVNTRVCHPLGFQPQPPAEATHPCETQVRKPQQTSARRPAGPDQTSEDQNRALRIHGLTVERYREVYNSVLQPPVLSTLSSAKNPDYVAQVLDLKQQLWERLSRPQLVEKVMQGGQVEVTEILDLP